MGCSVCFDGAFQVWYDVNHQPHRIPGMEKEWMAMNDQIRFLEELAANGHPPLNTMLYDGLLLRFSEGVTCRANSVSVIRPSQGDPAAKVAYCEACYAKQGLPAIFKLTDPDADLSAFLENRGYSVVTPTDVMILDLDSADLPSDTDGCVFSAEPSVWLPDYFAFEELSDPRRKDVLRRIFSRVLADTVYCTLLHGGRPAACASGALEQGYMLLQNVVADPALCGSGLGKKLCRAMLAKAKELGARYVCLQVVQSNTAAMNLYRGLGFRKVYTYWYMKQS